MHSKKSKVIVVLAAALSWDSGVRISADSSKPNCFVKIGWISKLVLAGSFFFILQAKRGFARSMMICTNFYRYITNFGGN